MQLTRRGFNLLCGTALVAETVTSSWKAFGLGTGAGLDGDTLASMSITEASAKIQAKTLTSTELVKALLDRINVYVNDVPVLCTYVPERSITREMMTFARSFTVMVSGLVAVFTTIDRKEYCSSPENWALMVIAPFWAEVEIVTENW